MIANIAGPSSAIEIGVDVYSVSSEESIHLKKFPLPIESGSYVVLKLVPERKKGSPCVLHWLSNMR